jgi:hypothetical protein
MLRSLACKALAMLRDAPAMLQLRALPMNIPFADEPEQAMGAKDKYGV